MSSRTWVIVDPVTNLLSVSTEHEVRSMLTRMVDFLKTQQITALFTSLTDAQREQLDLLAKLNLRNRVELARYAIRHRLIEP